MLLRPDERMIRKRLGETLNGAKITHRTNSYLAARQRARRNFKLAKYASSATTPSPASISACALAMRTRPSGLQAYSIIRACSSSTGTTSGADLRDDFMTSI
jgi:hypothetical protein